jgi:peroxiredoxin
MILRAGARAPEFSLKSTPDQLVSLRDFRGAPLVLVFYPADWSPVCGDQLVIYNELMSEFKRHKSAILGISVDNVWCHLAFAKDRKLRYALISDFEPKGAVARQYGAYRTTEGVAERALFVLDGEGIIRWSHLSPIGVNPGAEGILEALDKLERKEVTP